ncbi:MAG: EAL domain-containing protein, partial [Thermosynechococcaceae cyanobacterium]
FKIVNDTCGHGAGDELLKQIAHLLQKRLRKTDVLARLGGDEFGIVLHHCSLEQANAIAQNLLNSLESYRFIWQDKIFTIGASIGLTQMTHKSLEIGNVMTAADLACYAAKNQGGNRIHFYDLGSSDLKLHLSQMHWAVKIRQAIEDNSFRLYAQPIAPVLSRRAPIQFVLEGDRLVEGELNGGDLAVTAKAGLGELPGPSRQHFEILLRLFDGEGGIVSPSVFIPVAERYNLMPVIDRWVVRALFAFLRDQRSHLGSSADSTVEYAINLSGSSFNEPHFAGFLLEQLDTYQIEPTTICFEITETVAISNLSKAVEFIHTLKAVGCKFSLDDFGSGMSSFAYLQNLPIDYLKIDGSFVKTLNENPINLEIVRAINSIAHLNNIKTIAEFVETPDILETLRSLGVDFAQGYAIAKPELLKS